MPMLSFDDFLQKFFQKILSNNLCKQFGPRSGQTEYRSQFCKGYSDGSDLGDWDQTDCKGYQQTTKVSASKKIVKARNYFAIRFIGDFGQTEEIKVKKKKGMK